MWDLGKGERGIFVRQIGWRGEDWEESIVFVNFVKLGTEFDQF
jgi:hypothetical protein